MIFKFKNFASIEEKAKCPPGYKYNPKTKKCDDKRKNKIGSYRAFFSRYLNNKQNGNNSNTNGNNGNSNNASNGNAQNANGNGNSGGNGNGGSSGNGNSGSNSS